METLRTRLRRLEKEAGFRRWLEFSRLLETLSNSQLEEVAIYFRFPDPMPEPLPIGMSKLDGLDRKTLLRMCEEEERTIEVLRTVLQSPNIRPVEASEWSWRLDYLTDAGEELPSSVEL